jgi:hypothetical protein
VTTIVPKSALYSWAKVKAGRIEIKMDIKSDLMVFSKGITGKIV